MNFIIDEPRFIKAFIGSLNSSSQINRNCTLAALKGGIALIQNPTNFENMTCLQKQFQVIMMKSEMFVLQQVNVSLNNTYTQFNHDKQASLKNQKIEECFIEVELESILKPLKPLENLIKKLQIQVGFRHIESGYSSKVNLQLSLTCSLSEGNSFQMFFPVTEIQSVRLIKEILSKVEIFTQNFFQGEKHVQKDKLLLLCFDHRIGAELKVFNQDEGLDLQLNKEYVKVVPILQQVLIGSTQSEVTFTPVQFKEYKFQNICEEYGWIKHLLMDPNFINPTQKLLQRHELQGYLYIGRKRDQKRGQIYLFSHMQNYMYSVSNSTAIVNLYDEKYMRLVQSSAPEIDLKQLEEILDIKEQNNMNTSQVETSDSNSNPFFYDELKVPKKIHFGRLEPGNTTDQYSKFISFAEEFSKNTITMTTEQDLQRARERFQKAKYDKKN